MACIKTDGKGNIVGNERLQYWLLDALSKCIKCRSKNVDVLFDNGSKNVPEETDMQMTCGDCGIRWHIVTSQSKEENSGTKEQPVVQQDAGTQTDNRGQELEVRSGS